MSAFGDLEYYAHRASVERHRAKIAPSPVIAGVHEQLAQRYEELVQETTTSNVHHMVFQEQEERSA